MEIEKNAIKEEVAKNFMFYRKKNNLTQKALADELGVKNNTISQWENCTNSIDVEILFRACEILNVSINDMYGKYYIDRNSGYSQGEKAFIDQYRSLNEEGQEKVTQYIEDLILSGRYIKSDKYSMANEKQA